MSVSFWLVAVVLLRCRHALLPLTLGLPLTGALTPSFEELEPLVASSQRLLRRESSDDDATPKATTTPQAKAIPEPASRRLAILIAGVKPHFLLTPLVEQVVKPSVQKGYKVDFYLSLVDLSKGGPYKGTIGHPCVDPAIANLTHEDFKAHVQGAVQGAGGELMELIQLTYSEPIDNPPEGYSRLRDYPPVTVETGKNVLRRWRSIQALWDMARLNEREKFPGHAYNFVLWAREDQYWFSPFDVRSFERDTNGTRPKMYTRNCNLYSGISDKVILFERSAADKMLKLYTEFYQNKEPMLDQGESAEAFIKLSATLKKVEWEHGRIAFKRLPSLDAQFVRATSKSKVKICLKPYYAGDCLQQWGLPPGVLQPPRCDDRHSLFAED